MRRTEMQHELARGLHAASPGTVLERLLAGQQQAAAALWPALPAIEAAARRMAETLAAGDRVAYAGAGSSGLMALADALELAGTFGIPADRTPVLFAGGAAALITMQGAVEDDAAAAARDVSALGPGARDALVAVSASGSTPYTLAVAEAARERGVTVIALVNAAESPLQGLADLPILIDTGPELVAGSTRMGAATAQKVALNMISTLAGVLLGHVHDGYMVNVVADNAKLRDRAARMVASIAGTPEPAARTALDTTDGAVKPAVLVAAGASRGEAERLLGASRGHIGPALAALQA